MSGNSLLEQLMGAAKTLLPLVVPGAGAVVAAAEKIGEAMTTAHAMFGRDADPKTVQEFDAMREDLEERTRAAVHATADKLRG